MEIRELTIREKRYYPNASYVIITNTNKQYYAKKALIELQTKLNKLLISGVVGSYNLKVGDNIKLPSGLKAKVIETKVKVKDEFGCEYYLSNIEVG